MKKLTAALAVVALASVVHLAAQTVPRWDRDRDEFPGTVQAAGVSQERPCDSRDRQSEKHRTVVPTRSAIGQTASAVNPDDINYGGLLAEWRLAAVRETIEQIYFWTILVMGLALSALLLLLMHEDREKQRRLAITADVVAQLFNAWSYANYTARTAIAKHNEWVTRLDGEYEVTLRGVPEMGAPSVTSLPTNSPDADPWNLDDNPASNSQTATPAVVTSKSSSLNQSPAPSRPTANSGLIPSLVAAGFKSGLANKEKFFGQQSRKSPNTPFVDERRSIDVDAALASANEAAARAVNGGDDQEQEFVETPADEVKRLRQQVAAQQLKISAQQQQLNRDRERRAREEGKLSVGQGTGL